MLVWQDIFTRDVVISDPFRIENVIDSKGATIPGMFKVDSKTVRVDQSLVGDDDSVAKVNNITDDRTGFGYTETGFETKAELKQYLRDYLVRILNHLKDSHASDEKIDHFKSESGEILKFLNSKFAELQFYLFRSMNSQAGMAFSYYEGESHDPTFMYITWGLEEVKS